MTTHGEDLRVTRKGDDITLSRRCDDLSVVTQAARGITEPDEHLVRQGVRTYKVARGRNGQIAARVMNGESLRRVADDVGLSGERVRQIAARYDAPGMDELRAEIAQNSREELSRDRVREYAQEHPEESALEIARAMNHVFTLDEVIAILGPKEMLTRPVRPAQDKPVIYDDEACFAALRAASRDENGNETVPVSAQRYASMVKDGPSVPTIIIRFGSWRDACDAAGVSCASPTRAAGWERDWDDDGLVRCAAQFFKEHGVKGTTAAYAAWAKDKNAAYRSSKAGQQRVEAAAKEGRKKIKRAVPSLATLRNRLGSWGTIQMLALQELARQEALKQKKAADRAQKAAASA